VKKLVSTQLTQYLSHSTWEPLISTWPHLRCDVGLEEGEVSFYYSIVCHYNGAQWYEQFLQVGRLYCALILLGLALYLLSAWVPLCLGLYDAIYIYIKFFLLTFYLYDLVSWAWWDWLLTLLSNHRLSVLLWRCFLGHWLVKSSPEMTYMCRSGTLDPTIPYSTFDSQWFSSYLPSAMYLRSSWCYRYV